MNRLLQAATPAEEYTIVKVFAALDDLVSALDQREEGESIAQERIDKNFNIFYDEGSWGYLSSSLPMASAQARTHNPYMSASSLSYAWKSFCDDPTLPKLNIVESFAQQAFEFIYRGWDIGFVQIRLNSWLAHHKGMLDSAAVNSEEPEQNKIEKIVAPQGPTKAETKRNKFMNDINEAREALRALVGDLTKYGLNKELASATKLLAVDVTTHPSKYLDSLLSNLNKAVTNASTAVAKAKAAKEKADKAAENARAQEERKEKARKDAEMKAQNKK